MDKQFTINIAIYFPFIFSFLASMVLLWKVKLSVKNDQISKETGKANYTVYVLLVGAFSAIILFFGLIIFFNISGGHGYAYIAVPIFHIFVSAILIFLGRILIGWEYYEIR